MDEWQRRSREERLLLDLKGVDPKLVAAFIEVVNRQAGEDKPVVVVPVVGEMWLEWVEAVAKGMPSWRSIKVHGNRLRTVEVALERNETRTVFSMAWPDCTPEFGDRYRAKRVTMPNRRKGRDGERGTVAHSTVNRELASLQSMFVWHHEVKRSIDRNPLDGVRLVDERQFQRKTYLSPEQAKAFIEAGPPMWQDITFTAYRCVGMRHSEARLLRKSEIDWEAKVINLPSRRNKNRVARPIPFPEDVEKILRLHCEISKGPYVFVSPRDPARVQPVKGGAMQYWMENARKKSGVVGFDGETVVVHHLRHAGVTRLVEAGAPEGFIKAAAGMSDVTFRRYMKFQRPQQEILRGFMNKIVAAPAEAPPAEPPPPQPITAELRSERKNPRRLASPPGARRRKFGEE